MSYPYTLIRNCSLLRNHRRDGESYILGTLSRVAPVTSPFQRSALIALAAGTNPLRDLPHSQRAEIEEFIATLVAHGFITTVRAELIAPKRYLDTVTSRDRSIAQLRARSAPELAQAEWIDGVGDGGTSTLAARTQYAIELSGRSRVITLLYSILLASGVTNVRFNDRFYRSEVTDLDIGFGAITAGDLGGNYYTALEASRPWLALFPRASNEMQQAEKLSPILSVHYGECDPEQSVEWLLQRRPHLIIHPSIGDEIAIGPLVIPRETPCLRCLSLYEIDQWGFTFSERISLNPIADIPAHIAHYLAGIAASQILHFIDSYGQSERLQVARNTGIGEVTYLNFQRLTEPQVVAIARHPLCGCDR
jgi:hypothetical protein